MEEAEHIGQEQADPKAYGEGLHDLQKRQEDQFRDPGAFGS